MKSLLPNIKFENSGNFLLIAGPCAVEDKDTCFRIAEAVSKLSEQYKIPYIFKASYKKANRSRLDSFSGIGNEKAIRILSQVKTEFDLPILSDVHSPEEVQLYAGELDVLQIPAFLCRQTDLLVAAANTKKIVNIKKGQFMGPSSMRFAVDKVMQSEAGAAWLTERGTTFGYQDLVVDFRSIPAMKEFAQKVIVDCTHSLQQPNQSAGVTGGRPELIETIAKAAIAVGADGLFIETHPDPSTALSDGANMLPLDRLSKMLESLVRIKEALI